VVKEKSDGYSVKEQELIRQLVQARLGKKTPLEFESLIDYNVPDPVYFPHLKKPFVTIRANNLTFSMSSIHLFEGVQHIVPMTNYSSKRMVAAPCAEVERSSLVWARKSKGKWANRTVTCPEYTQSIFRLMDWNDSCRYRAYGILSDSERGLVIVYDLISAVMYAPLPEEYFDKRSGKMKKRTIKYYPDEIRMSLGRSYSDYEAIQRQSNFESLSGYTDTSGTLIPSTISEEAAASISAREQERRREEILDTLMGKGAEEDG
jgi:hypothetical protein